MGRKGRAKDNSRSAAELHWAREPQQVQQERTQAASLGLQAPWGDEAARDSVLAMTDLPA